MTQVESDLVAALPPEPPKPRRKRAGVIPFLALMLTGLVFFGAVATVFLSGRLDQEKSRVLSAIAGDATIQREIGAIESCQLAWNQTHEVAAERKQIYDVVGAKGSGQLVVQDLGWGLLYIELVQAGQTSVLTTTPYSNSSFTKLVTGAIQDAPAIQTRIGDIRKVRIDWALTQQLTDEDCYAIPVSGTKGSALVVSRIEPYRSLVLWSKLQDGDEEIILHGKPGSLTPYSPRNGQYSPGR